MFDVVKAIVVSYSVMAASWWLLVEVPARVKAQQLELRLVKKNIRVPENRSIQVVIGTRGPICVQAIQILD